MNSYEGVNNHIKNEGSINRCTTSCIDDEFMYKEKVGETETSYCYNIYPAKAKYYYTEGITVDETTIKPKECFSSCNKKHFNTKNDNICITSCSNLTTVDLDNNLFTCLNDANEDKCPQLFP